MATTAHARSGTQRHSSPSTGTSLLDRGFPPAAVVFAVVLLVIALQSIIGWKALRLTWEGERIEEAQVVLRDAEAKLPVFEKQLEQKAIRLAKLKEEVDRFEKRRDELAREVGGHERRLSELAKTIASQSESFAKAQKRHGEATGAIETLEKRRDELKTKVGELETTLVALERNRAGLAEEERAYAAKIAERKGQIDAADKRVAAAREEELSLTKGAAALTTQVAEKRQALARLEALGKDIAAVTGPQSDLAKATNRLGQVIDKLDGIATSSAAATKQVAGELQRGVTALGGASQSFTTSERALAAEMKSVNALAKQAAAMSRDISSRTRTYSEEVTAVRELRTSLSSLVEEMQRLVDAMKARQKEAEKPNE